MSDIKLAIIEDESLVRQSLEALFEASAGISLVASKKMVETFLEEVAVQPDILLLDIGLKGGMTGLQGIRPIKEKFPDTDIIMLTTFEESDYIFKALCAGATAYLTKRTPFPKLVDAVHTVYRGGSYMSPSIAKKVVQHFAPKEKPQTILSPRQHQIVEAVVEGMSYKMVADKLMISTETVKDHIKKIYRKLEINSKGELIQRKLSGELD